MTGFIINAYLSNCKKITLFLNPTTTNWPSSVDFIWLISLVSWASTGLISFVCSSHNFSVPFFYAIMNSSLSSSAILWIISTLLISPTMKVAESYLATVASGKGGGSSYLITVPLLVPKYMFLVLTPNSMEVILSPTLPLINNSNLP